MLITVDPQSKLNRAEFQNPQRHQGSNGNTSGSRYCDCESWNCWPCNILGTSQVGYPKFGIRIFRYFEGRWICSDNMGKCMEGLGCCWCWRLSPPPTCPTRWFRIVTTSLITGQQTSAMRFKEPGNQQTDREVRFVKRSLLLDVLAKELPSGTIRYLSKVVAIEESGFYKILHLSDGTTIKTKVLIGCDGVNSVVAKWLGFKKASFTGRYAIRGCAEVESNHGLEPWFTQFFGKGFRAGVIPFDGNTVYWFFTSTPTTQDKELHKNPAKLRECVKQARENAK